MAKKSTQKFKNIEKIFYDEMKSILYLFVEFSLNKIKQFFFEGERSTLT